MEEGYEMNADQLQYLDSISKNLPTFEEMLAEMKEGLYGDAFFRYYYPLCFRYTAEFFSDPQDAENALLPLFEHWREVAPKHDNSAKLATYFRTVAKNFCLNYQRDTSYGPELVFQSEEPEVDDEEDTGRVTEVAFTEEYPTDGVDHDDPETLYLRKEEQEIQDYRAREIRDQLYPGDQQVFDLLLENYNSDDIASILERSVVSVENALRRIRATTKDAGYDS